jgi:hypothetical protein
VMTSTSSFQVQERFDVDIKPLPDKIDSTTYMNTVRVRASQVPHVCITALFSCCIVHVY